ncbi:MAG: hypothetical protein IKS19_07105 [Clostridia bacterium]|nr:hypothetical protein [Clostridia bacterium]
MISYCRLSGGVQAAQAIWVLLLLLSFVFILVRSIGLKRGGVMTAATVALMLLCYVPLQLMTAVIRVERGLGDGDWAYGIMERVPEMFWTLLFMPLTMLSVVMIIDLFRFHHRKLSALSIKAATDNIPVGMCFYLENGRVLLINRAMNAISRKASGRIILRGDELYRCIFSSEETERFSVIDSDRQRILKFPDGSVFGFVRRTIETGSGHIYELTASDISEEYALSDRLRQNNIMLERQRDHLRRFGDLVTHMTIQKEIFNAKVKIHDDLGSTLIATKRYLLSRSEQNREAVLELWKKNVGLLKNEGPMPQRDDYSVVLKAADDVGVKVEITGRLPAAQPAAHVLACAMNECITNTIRHARGNTLFVEIEQTDTGCTAVLRNNGDPPENDIRETGGLRNLRQMVHDCGGFMSIQSRPGFALTLALEYEGEMIHGL